MEDVFESEMNIHMVMEIMQGGELFDYVVAKGTLSESEASVMVRKVCVCVSCIVCNMVFPSRAVFVIVPSARFCVCVSVCVRVYVCVFFFSDTYCTTFSWSKTGLGHMRSCQPFIVVFLV